MDLTEIRCLVALADELHFGRAAQKLEMLPASLGRYVRLLEEDLGVRLVHRTTRSVALTKAGADFLEEARELATRADALAARFRTQARDRSTLLRIGAIDSAAAGLLPLLLQDLRARHPGLEVRIFEDKTIRLLPRLLSGRLDLAILRPPESRDARLTFRHLFFETAVVALNERHALAAKPELPVQDLSDQPMIVPERRSRPHSHDLTVKLFAEAGLSARVAQIADEKQTIVNLVAAGLGIAIVPRWVARLAMPGVVFRPIAGTSGATATRLPLAVAYMSDTRDPARDAALGVLSDQLAHYAAQA